ncbi:MAG TPA: hypothetical protein GX691_02030 [Clostridia bacterium]|jgi:uncharacterized membrane protein|nr:hypothetical protein [Clostridia bacterium]
MGKTVVGLFKNERVAEEAVRDLRGEGFEKEISILAKDRKEGGREGVRDATFETSDSIADGTTTGGILGGLAGLAAGAGALAIPGIGPIVAAGPISGILAGAASGGIAGGLLDWGIPEEESRQIESEVKQGKVLVAVSSSQDKVDRAEKILRDHGGENIKVHEK